MTPLPPPERPVSSMRRLSVIFYALLTLAGLAIGWWRGQSVWHTEPWLAWPSGRDGLAASLALGVGLAAMTVLSTRWAVVRFRWASALHVELRRLVGPADRITAVVLAVTSAIGEEILFRGALQPWIGYVLASVFFGLVHIGPSSRFLPWTAWAVVMGFLFGAIHGVSGHLAGCILAHGLINYAGFRFLAEHDPGGDDGAPPNLVVRRERR